MPNSWTETQVVTAHLFHCTAGPRKHAITLDLTASNLPAATCLTGWVYDGEVHVSAGGDLPFQAAPELVLRGLRSAGYFVWHESSEPKAVSRQHD